MGSGINVVKYNIHAVLQRVFDKSRLEFVHCYFVYLANATLNPN